MKKKVCLLLAQSILVTMFVYGGEAAEMWTRLYNRSTNFEQKYAIMLNLVEQDDAGLIPTLQTALGDLLRDSRNVKTAKEKDAWVQLSRVIVGGLSKLKATEAAPVLFLCSEVTDSPLLKAEALAAVGKVRGTQYTEKITLLLKDLNLTPAADASAGEIIAYGCINSLEKLKGDEAYKQVFLASVGWYSKRVKNRAAEALPAMSDDPTSILIGILIESSPETKLAALEAGKASSAPAEKKIELAVKALERGLYEQPGDLLARTTFGKLRSLAIGLLIDLKAKSDLSLKPLRDIIEKNYDLNERLSAVTALGVNSGPEAVKILAEVLDNQNQRQAAGITDADYRFTTALIKALGMTKSKAARPVLMAVEFSNYTPAIERIAQEALQNIDK